MSSTNKPEAEVNEINANKGPLTETVVKIATKPVAEKTQLELAQWALRNMTKKEESIEKACVRVLQLPLSHEFCSTVAHAFNEIKNAGKRDDQIRALANILASITTEEVAVVVDESNDLI